jgi:hypothetical protein
MRRLWGGGAVAPVRVHALRMRVDAFGRPIAYLGYETHEADLAHEATTTVDRAAGGRPRASRASTARSCPPAVACCWQSVAWVRVDDDLELPFFTQMPGAGYLDMMGRAWATAARW